jgi:hypothetical protein
MGLAYDLKTKLCAGYVDWNYMFASAAIYPSYQQTWTDLWQNIHFDDGAGNTVFDIIIRGESYANDYYYIWGSYRANFQFLYGPTPADSGVCWDGFVAIIPAFYIHARFDGEPDHPMFTEQNAISIIPGRFPFTLAPGAADSATINNDSEPGYYGLDVALGLSNVATTYDCTDGGWISVSPSNSRSLNFYAVGHQRTYHGNFTPNGMDYAGTGNTWVIELPQFPYNYEQMTGFPPSILEGSFVFIMHLESWGWSRSTTYDNNGVGQFPVGLDALPKWPFDLEYYTTVWRNPVDMGPNITSGQLIDGSSSDGYIISRIYSCSSTQETIFAGNGFGNGFNLMCGEAVRLDGLGGIQYTCPFFSIFAGAGSSGKSPNINYPVYGSTPAAIKTAIDDDFLIDDSVALYDFENAWANVIVPGLNQVTFDSFLNTFIVGFNNLTVDGVAQPAIYMGNFADCIYDNGFLNATIMKWYALAPLAVEGNQFTAQTGIAMPIAGSKWTGAARQQATFSPRYESSSKLERRWANPSFDTNDQYVVDQDLYEIMLRDPTISNENKLINSLVGVGGNCSGNYYKGGVAGSTYTSSGGGGVPTLTNPYSNLGYGLLAYQPSEEPYIWMYDFGTVSGLHDPSTNPLEISVRASGTQQGDDMNAAFVIAPSATTRYPLSASWDNDRDQWIFTFTDATNGAGIMSVNSAFSETSEDQISFLEQTSNYIFPGTFITVGAPQAAIHTARMMTPILDGLTIFGLSDDVTSKGQKALSPWTFDAGTPQEVKSFLLYTIDGTTGRTARVWVDYLLFDGVDSMISLELQKLGLRVTVENVEWYKAKILRKGELGLTVEEIEDWVRSQQEEYRAMLKTKERVGRLRRRRRQVAAWREGLEDTDSIEKGGFDSLKEFDHAAAEYVPSHTEHSPDTTRKSKNTSTKGKKNRDTGSQ